MNPHLDRRRLLLGSLSVAGLALSAQASVRLPRSSSRPSLRGERKLVLVQLSGGNDGLSMLVPYADPAYHKARSTTRIGVDEVLKLDKRVGLHPALGRLKGVYDAGRLALVEGVGYPNAVRSHFKSMDIWHAAAPEGRAADRGWVGRLCAHAWPDADLPELVVHVGRRVPYSLHSSTQPPVAFEIPEGYRWLGDERRRESYAEAALGCDEEPEGATSGSEAMLARLRATLGDAQRSSDRVRQAAAAYRPAATYPATPLGDALRVTAAMIDADIGTRVLSVETGGYDTHSNQRARHDALMRTLDGALAAFLEDLEKKERDDVLVLVFSEFGRRVAENASRGTDHGKASVLLAAGPAVKGGLYGQAPSLANLDEGDLAFTTDFRRAYATALGPWLAQDATQVLGTKHQPLGFVRA